MVVLEGRARVPEVIAMSGMYKTRTAARYAELLTDMLQLSGIEVTVTLSGHPDNMVSLEWETPDGADIELEVYDDITAGGEVLSRCVHIDLYIDGEPQ